MIGVLQSVIMWACAAALVAIASVVILAGMGKAAMRAKRRLRGAVGIFAALAVACILFARKGTITVDDPYIQNSGSYLTNDVAHVALAKRTQLLPDDTDILVYARQVDQTNATDWVRLEPHLTFAEHPYDYALNNATNYDVLIAANYSPAPTVHTNGVWQMKGFNIPGTSRYNFPNSRARLTHGIYDAEVEWLGSTNVSSYIETGVYHSTSNAVRFKLRLPALAATWGSAYTAYVNEQTATTRLIRYSNESGRILVYHGHVAGGGGTSYYGVSNNHTTLIEGVTTRNSATINGVTFAMPNPSVSTLTKGMRLLGSSGARIYRFAIDNQIDLQPVRFTNKSGASEGAFYDRISGRLFRNQGLVPFDVGPDKQGDNP